MHTFALKGSARGHRKQMNSIRVRKGFKVASSVVGPVGNNHLNLNKRDNVIATKGVKWTTCFNVHYQLPNVYDVIIRFKPLVTDNTTA